MPTFWIRFYLRHCLLLVFTGLLIAVLFHGNHLDLLLADPLFDFNNHLWPYRGAWWSKTLVHSWFKGGMIVFALFCLWKTWRHRKAIDARRWRVVAAAIFAVPTIVSVWKRNSAMHCPWYVDRYDGNNPYFDFFSAIPGNVVDVGHCFPAGFVSTVGWLLAFALLRYPEDRKFSRRAGLAALATCLFFGLVQQMRGAHFMSHVLWTIWLSWAIVLALHAMLGAWRQPPPPTT